MPENFKFDPKPVKSEEDEVLKNDVQENGEKTEEEFKKE